MILFKPFVEVPIDFINKFGLEKIITYNLSSYIDGFPILQEIFPDNRFDGIPYDTVEFDSMYSNYIVENNASFSRLMDIILPVYNYPDVLVQILISYSPYRDCIAEAIAKLIQQRYGYNCYTVNTMEDMYFVRDDSTISIPGLILLNRDLERYAAIIGPITGEIYRDE